MPAVFVFDGDCGFCAWSAARLQRWASGELVVAAWQTSDLTSLGLTEAQCSSAVQLVEAGGVSSGGAAIAGALQRCRQPWRAVGRILGQPCLAPAAKRGYAVVAANRHRLPGATPACALHGDERSRSGVGGQRPRETVSPTQR